MSLSRAFTMKRNRGLSTSDSTTPMANRSLTVKHSGIKNKISGPMELISTTNMLSYSAPNIYPKGSPLSSRSSNSDDDSDRSNSTASSPTTEASSVGSQSPSLGSPELNHLSCYFGQAPKDFALEEAPVIPKRAPSHTKQNSEITARKRTSGQSRMSSSNHSISTRSSINMFSANVDAPDSHPFGNELAKVTELAEDYGISPQTFTVVDAEEQELVSKGLFKFRAEDYMSEIHGLFISSFVDVQPAMTPTALWI